MVWWLSGVVDVWCGGCPILPMVWWMSGVVDVCVVDVVQSYKCEDKSRLRQLNICSNHLNFGTEFFRVGQFFQKRKHMCSLVAQFVPTIVNRSTLGK